MDCMYTKLRTMPKSSSVGEHFNMNIWKAEFVDVLWSGNENNLSFKSGERTSAIDVDVGHAESVEVDERGACSG